MKHGLADSGSGLHLDQILSRELEQSNQRLRFVGTSSPSAVGYFLSEINSSKIRSLPHIVVVSSQQEANQLIQSIEFFDRSRDVFLLSGFDVSPYSGMDNRLRSTAERLSFLFHAQNAKPGQIFVAPLPFLLQRTCSFKYLNSNSKSWKQGDLFPENIHQYLQSLSYLSAPLVEDVGQYSLRGGILDVFSPAHDRPVRIELFGEEIESLRYFSTSDQRSDATIDRFNIIPVRDFLINDSNIESTLSRIRDHLAHRDHDTAEAEEIFRALVRYQLIPGYEFLLPFVESQTESVFDHFSSPLNVWFLDSMNLPRVADDLLSELRSDFQSTPRQVIRPEVNSLFLELDILHWPEGSQVFEFNNIDSTFDGLHLFNPQKIISYNSYSVTELANSLSQISPGSEPWLRQLAMKFDLWHSENYRLFISIKNQTQAERIRVLLDKISWKVEVIQGGDQDWLSPLSMMGEHSQGEKILYVVLRILPESFRNPEDRVIFLRDDDLFGKKNRRGSSSREVSSSEQFQTQAKLLAFGDLKPGDCVVHIKHGVGVYEGLRVMNVGGVESEFIQLSYKDKDKLYLPVYRIGQLQKYAGASTTTILDKLGGTSWEKTKTKVKSHLKDIASELLNLYARRSELHRPPFQLHKDDYASFESAFPYDETDDQLRAINDFVRDLTSDKPMDRLVCGDVGFGKTEIAMRAAFVAVHNQKQVVVLAPTTVLSFQHFETFKKRFHGWPVEIRALNRFVASDEVKKTLNELKTGKVDILIGTHRVLSKDVEFQNLGLMIIDEEHKFGVTHKEKIKKLKTSVDTMTLSATPIPRTLNMSLVGIRDLSLINTAPVDRLPTRTFISKFDENTIRKAIESEMARGGQVYFIHNRVQSIFGIADQVRQIVPQARIRVGHGQMNEEELEKTMVAFFNHEIDVLVCTTIVESGMDIPRANTMFIDQAHMLGLSQLYQLRGRVGRSKQRAYCYLIVPDQKKLDKDAQERLKVLQENTALGSGIRIAQYDLELRGTGNLLGEEQSGHINAVGYELYMDLLNEAIHSLKGEPIEEMELDPEINLRIPAMIPDSYISDIRIRLSFYKALAEIRNEEDLEKIESELKDQFGDPPEATINLMGLMLIRSACRKLGVQDVSSGMKSISVKFSEKTKFKPETAISLAMRENKKYSITPDSRLNIRMNNITWPGVYEEINYLMKLI
jgi:transcription-repair coupling factor (superfamily II helicase)